MRKRIPRILLFFVTGMFFMTILSIAQQTGSQKPAVKPKSTNIQRQPQPVQARPMVYTIRELENIRWKDLKNTDLIDIGDRRFTVREIMDMISRRELKVDDPNNAQEVARALLDLYSNGVRSGVTLTRPGP